MGFLRIKQSVQRVRSMLSYSGGRSVASPSETAAIASITVVLVGTSSFRRTDRKNLPVAAVSSLGSCVCFMFVLPGIGRGYRGIADNHVRSDRCASGNLYCPYVHNCVVIIWVTIGSLVSRRDESTASTAPIGFSGSMTLTRVWSRSPGGLRQNCRDGSFGTRSRSGWDPSG